MEDGRITIRLAKEDIQAIQKIMQQYGYSKSSAVRHMVHLGIDVFSGKHKQKTTIDDLVIETTMILRELVKDKSDLYANAIARVEEFGKK
jgi:N-acetyl-anhydromuramyl-L-alanine amidase AmpD